MTIQFKNQTFEHRYEYPLLICCESLHGEVGWIGRGNHSSDELERRISFLDMRLRDWNKGYSDPSKQSLYDSCIQMLCIATIKEYIEYINKAHTNNPINLTLKEIGWKSND